MKKWPWWIKTLAILVVAFWIDPVNPLWKKSSEPASGGRSYLR